MSIEHGQQTGEVLPQLTKEARNWGVLAHVSALLGFVPPTFLYGSIAGPLLLWMIKGKEHPFIEASARESLNFQLSILIYSVLASLTICIGIGIVILPALWIADIVLVIMAAVKAGDGIVYRYPISLRLIH